MSMRIHVIGLGVEQPPNLNAIAIEAIKQSRCVIGSDRQLSSVKASVDEEKIATMVLPKLSELKSWIDQVQFDSNDQISILASGDPLYYGIGAWVSRNFSDSEIVYYPAVSSIQAACHVLGVSLQDVNVISAHGRSINHLRRDIRSNRTMVILTDKQSTPSHIAQECKALGFNQARIVVCERLGYRNQTIRSFNVNDDALKNIDFDSLHVTILFTRSSNQYVAEFPGIPDDQFHTDKGNGAGLITKREVRLSILSMLQITSQDCFWDVGAGCGSIAIEAQRWCPKADVYAIENHSNRAKLIQKNAEEFGVMSLVTVVEGKAPQALRTLPNPNKVFIGGSGETLTENLNFCWRKLPTSGVLVVSAVTEQSKQQCMHFLTERERLKESEFEAIQLSVSRAGKLANALLFRPNLPVTIYKWTKTCEANNE